MIKRSWMSSSMFALELEEIAEFDFVYTITSTNINQSVPNLVKMNTTTRSLISSFMDVFRPELSKLFDLKLENLPYFTFYTLASAKINQSAPNLVKMSTTIRSRMSLIMDLIGPELAELSVLELEKMPYLTLFTIQHLQI